MLCLIVILFKKILINFYKNIALLFFLPLNPIRLSELEKSKLSTINQFFCGMHFIVGLAYIAEAPSKNFDQFFYGGKALANQGYSKNGV